ncbi:MAG: hypothetical protein ACOVOT_05725 [Rubrivivax sp.]|nr:hypothetical protein [Rubrivivax sp.]
MSMTSGLNRTLIAALGGLAVAATIAGCLGGSGDGDTRDTVVVQGDVPIVYAKRATTLGMNPTDGTPTAPGGDLLLREKSSPSAREHNLTARFTQGVGDVSDPEASPDGRKVVFAMRCPASNTATVDGTATGARACTGRWNLWEYEMRALEGDALIQGTFRRLTASNQHDDVDPAYLPANRGVVFASNRQHFSSTDTRFGRAYHTLDEYERERVLNLHTINATGGDLKQISFNMSHERNPVVRANGDILFSRWEHVGDRNRFAIFKAKPDGTDMFVLYGAHSPGNSYLHPREMDPRGKYKGFLASTLMSLSGTQEGGSLEFIDAANYSEFNTPASRNVPAAGGQRQGTDRQLSDGRGLSTFGRVTTPFPLWDGTDRILLSYRPCEVTRNGVVTACANLTTDEIARVQTANRSMADRAADPIQDNAPAAYAVWMFDPGPQTWTLVAAPPPGFMYVDPIALQPRTEPSAAQPTTVDDALAARGMALIEVRSVYDTDGLNRMSENMLVAADRRAGCDRAIAMRAVANADPTETRSQVADLVRMKDPADPAYGCAPVRFVRAIRAVGPPSGMTGTRGAIGETDFEQQQIIGYAPIEPDGSFKLEVPADIPLALSVVDEQGRAFQTHTNWIQVRPGERRTCDGCHSPRRGAALNAGSVVNTMPAALMPSMASQHQSGETLASLRTRLDPAALLLAASPVFSDVWADTTRAGVQARPTLALRYAGNVDPADDLTTPVPQRGYVNYPDHIQPIWEKVRGPGGSHTCVACHGETARTNLLGTVSGTGRIVSYEELLMGEPQLDAATGQPRIRVVNGVPEVIRGPALVNTSSGAMSTAGQTRKSRLGEILFGQSLLAGADSRVAYPAPPASTPTLVSVPDHSMLLNKAEKRLVSEWMDLGGQYVNDPFTAAGNLRTVTALSQTSFEAEVQPTLRALCVNCHTPGAGFQRNRFVLTGSPEGDYGATLSMVSDTCRPERNPLLARPSTIPHPNGALTQTEALLPATGDAYRRISQWIARGCSNN